MIYIHFDTGTEVVVKTIIEKNSHVHMKFIFNDWIFNLFSCLFPSLSFSLFSRIYIKILNQEYKVFYIGTNNGRIYKIVQFMQDGDSKSTLLDIFEVAQNEPIQVMQISQKRKSLYVSTDHRIKQIDLAMCSRRYDSCFRCVKDPYCGWDQDTNSCKAYELGLLQVNDLILLFHFFIYSFIFIFLFFFWEKR